MKCTVSETGKLGQRVVESLLLKNGYCCIQPNVRKGKYEFDIIANKGGTRAIFEVRTTTKSRLPFEIFPPLKILTVLAGAHQYYPSAVVIFVHVLYQLQNVTKISWYSSQDLL
ncbi:MAG: YraN family protein [Patescibacteria group bacterium]